MTDHRRRDIVTGSVTWVGLALVTLLTLGEFNIEFFYIVSYIGLLVVSQLYAPVETIPDWWKRLRVVHAAGFVVFGYVVAQRILLYLQ